MKLVNIKMIRNGELIEKEYPVTYSVASLLWFSDFLGVSTVDVLEIINEGGMTERKGMALMYSGLQAGAEEKGKRLDISFSEFQELIVFGDDELSSTLGTLFQKDFEIAVTKMQRKVDAKKPAAKKKPATRISKKST